MSHIVTIKTQFRSLEAIKAAAERLGGTFHEGQQTYVWFGQYMGDYPLPAGVAREDLGKCDHAISFPGCTYQLGIVKTGPTTFELRWDFWERAIREKLGGEAAPLLKQAYAIEAARLEARRRGHGFVEQKQADGSIKLSVTTR